jgi:glucokinase
MTWLGLDVGGTKILAVEVGPEGTPQRTERVRTPGGAEPLLGALVELIGSFHDVEAVGVGIPGLVDRTGRLRFGANLPDIVELPVADELASRTGRRIAVENDATCATWAEVQLGAARGASDVVLVTMGTGIGGGVVAGGALQRGANGFAGEPGHMVVDPNGPYCPCGRRGCWERYASGGGLGRMARELAQAGKAPRVVELAGGDPEAVRGEHVTVAAAEGDPGALAVIRDFGWWAALGIANLVNLLDPEIVVIGGGLVEAGDLLLDPIRNAYPGLVLAAEHRPDVPIVAAQLGEQAGAIGAALIARDRSRDRDDV